MERQPPPRLLPGKDGRRTDGHPAGHCGHLNAPRGTLDGVAAVADLAGKSVSTQRRGKRSTKRTPSAVSNDATLRPTVNPQPPCGAGQSARLGQGNEMAKIFPVEHRCILAQAV
jgi:hypothetical protein